jgi:hypothetical protein
MPLAFDFPPDEPFTTPEFQRLIPNSFVELPSRLAMFGRRALVHVSFPPQEVVGVWRLISQCLC